MRRCGSSAMVWVGFSRASWPTEMISTDGFGSSMRPNMVVRVYKVKPVTLVAVKCLIEG